MSTQTQVPVRRSVGAALRFAVDQWRVLATYSAYGALATMALAALSGLAPYMGIVASLFTTGVQAAIYTLFLSLFLGAPAGNWARRAAAVWGAMAVIAFFLCIVFLVLSLPVSMIMLAGPLAPYAGDLQAAGANEAAVMDVMLRFVEAEPLSVLLMMLFFGAVWMLLTSRLYLAAPATADQNRVLTFDTWAWTKGATLRIVAARLLLLAPAYALVTGLAYLIAALFGFNPFDAGAIAAVAQNNAILFLLYVGVRSFLTFLLYGALEAGLSAYLYQGLKPPSVEPPAVA
jgi:hypothetical protein